MSSGITDVKLTERQRAILTGLSFGRAYVSASERGDKEIMQLLTDGLAVAWLAPGGAAMWEITPAGRAALTAQEKQ